MGALSHAARRPGDLRRWRAGPYPQLSLRWCGHYLQLRAPLGHTVSLGTVRGTCQEVGGLSPGANHQPSHVHQGGTLRACGGLSNVAGHLCAVPSPRELAWLSSLRDVLVTPTGCGGLWGQLLRNDPQRPNRDVCARLVMVSG